MIRDFARYEWARAGDADRARGRERVEAESRAYWADEVNRLGAKAFVEKYYPERKAERERLESMVEKVEEKQARGGEF